jgi:hypothetical protein
MARSVFAHLWFAAIPDRREQKVFHFSQPVILVIPDRHQRVRPEVAGPMASSVANPQSITPALGLWIPGSRASARAPE